MQIYIIVLWMVALDVAPRIILLTAMIVGTWSLWRRRWRVFWVCVLLALSAALFILIYG